jgi:hypothetical protein
LSALPNEPQGGDQSIARGARAPGNRIVHRVRAYPRILSPCGRGQGEGWFSDRFFAPTGRQKDCDRWRDAPRLPPRWGFGGWASTNEPGAPAAWLLTGRRFAAGQRISTTPQVDQLGHIIPERVAQVLGAFVSQLGDFLGVHFKVVGLLPDRMLLAMRICAAFRILDFSLSRPSCPDEEIRFRRRRFGISGSYVL